MSQRSQFIPSIAKSMASTIQRSNPARRQRSSALDPPADPEGRETVDLRTKIKHSLWRTAQKQLFNPNASRNIPPLHSSFIPDGELLDYIGEDDSMDTLLSHEDGEDYYLGLDDGGGEYNDAFGCMAEQDNEEETCLWLGTWDEDDDELLDSVHGDTDLLDIDSESGSQLSGCGNDTPLPSMGMSSSYQSTLSSLWCPGPPGQNFPSESEMLTDPVEENPSDGSLGNDVDMLCTV